MFIMADIEARAADPRELLRAREIILANKVRAGQKLGDTLGAEVQGSGKSVYRVTVSTALDGTCTCPFFRRTTRRFCKHVAALAMIWIDCPTDVRAIDPEVADAIDRMDEATVRALLVDAAGRNRIIRERILTGAWED